MPQKLQMPSRGSAAEAQWWRLSPESSDGHALRSVPHLEFIAAGMAGLLILGLLTQRAGGVIALAIIAAVILPWAVYYTSRHASWLLFVLVLIEVVAASSYAATSGDQLGALVRYPLGVLFVLPFVSSVWKSGILRKGGFRDYSIYLIWALVSVSYSILPEVSLARAFAAIIPFCALCAIAAEVRSGEDARRVTGVLLAACGIAVAANYLAMWIPGCTPWQPDTMSGMLRFAGFLTEPNEIGDLTLATVGAGFAYWPVANRRNKVLAAVAMIGALVQGVMADSRSPIIGIAVGCVVYLIWKYRVRGVIGVAALFAMLYAASFEIPRIYLDRGDVASFTGRQVAWDFAADKVKQSPLLGYGYEVEGQILSSQYFTGWDEVWDLGYHSSLHDGYLSRAVSLGIPMLLLWIFLTLRPMVSCFFPDGDPWKLRSIVPLALLPVLILNFTESIVDFRSFAGILMGLTWAMLECERLFARAQAERRAKVAEALRAPIVRALQAGHAS
jgi:O-antigen ligase